MTSQPKNNDIQVLPKINGLRYENIFPVYTIKKENKDFYFYNINNKIILPTKIDGGYIDNIVLDRTIPWTTLSYQIYGNIYLWYILYMMNNTGNVPNFVATIGKPIVFIKPEYITNVTSNLNV
jgi:hypothetical protein